MIEIAAPVAILLLGIIALAMGTNARFTRTEKTLMALSFAGHFVAAIAQIIIAKNVYAGGDNIYYMSEGSLLARAIEYHPQRFVQVWFDLLIHRVTPDTDAIMGAGSSTGSMIAITAALALVCGYSLYGAGVLVAFAALFGKLAILQVFRALLPASTRTRTLVGVMLMPSTVFWSAGIQKEAFVIAALGPLWLGIHWMLRRRFVRGVLAAVVGIVPIALLKPYTLFGLAIASGVWVAFARARVRQGGMGPLRIRPGYVLGGVALVAVSLVALQQIYPMYSTDQLTEDLARRQRTGAMMTATMDSQGGGGSVYSMGDESAMTLQKQILYAPLAIATALFRPLPFEANNALAFLASLEMLGLTLVLIYRLLRPDPRAMLSTLMSSPVLLAALAFALVFGTGVGLATTNFGSLSRYRMPLIPFYASIVLVVGAAGRAVARGPVTSPAAAMTAEAQALARARARARARTAASHARSS